MIPDRPMTRIESYLAKWAGQEVDIPDRPITRIECYLDYIVNHGGGGGGGGDLDATVYAFHIDGSNPDPAGAVTYQKDAIGMTPAHMDFQNNVFDWGSWADAFFLPRPCMLQSNGTVAYYLDPADYKKKADGTASEVADPAFDGNAMMEWGRGGRKIWYKIEPDPGTDASATVYISDRKVDMGYISPSFGDGAHFYTPIYNGSMADGQLRSLSGQSIAHTQTGQAEITAATANGSGWYIETLADRILINLLLILMGKSLDTQTVFGQGLTSGGQTAMEAYVTGAMDTAGLFGGSGQTTGAVKVFGMENWWGTQWRRTAGLLLISGDIRIKMEAPYNDTGSDYLDIMVTPSGTSGGYIDVVTFNEYGMFGKNSSGSSTTHLCDGQWFNASGARYSLFGGSSGSGARCGAFACYLNAPLYYADWSIGAALSYHPEV